MDQAVAAPASTPAIDAQAPARAEEKPRRRSIDEILNTDGMPSMNAEAPAQAEAKPRRRSIDEILNTYGLPSMIAQTTAPAGPLSTEPSEDAVGGDT